MISRIHSKLGTAGFIVAIVALVAALGGGAYAAQQGLNGKQKKEVKNIAKTEAKKFAIPGPAGPAGAAGQAGAKGDTGANGAAGTNGTNGTNGQSVTVTNEPAGANCKFAGKKLVSASGTTYVCNGETGYSEVLPPKESEYGNWGYGGGETLSYMGSSISYNIRYPGTTGPTLNFVKFVEAPTTNCPGSVTEPEAQPGHLCVYEIDVTGQTPGTFEAGLSISNPYGVTLYFTGEGFAKSNGTWAVTAP